MGQDCDFELPPTFRHHIVNGHAPQPQYYCMWAIGSVCFVIVVSLLLNRLILINERAKAYRDKNDLVVIPMAYSTVLLILAYPIIASFLKFLTLIVPYCAYTNSLLVTVWQGIALYFFAQLIIMYLGSIQNAIKSFSELEETRIWAVPPLGCCFRCLPLPFICCAKKHLTKEDFRTLDKFIIQFVLCAPTLSFIDLLKSFEGAATAQRVVGICKMITALLAMYAIGVLLRPARRVLAPEYHIAQKMKVIQLTILSAMIPGAIMNLVSGIGQNDDYSSQVMSEAYSATIFLILMVPVSMLYRKYFGVEDAIAALLNQQEKSLTASIDLHVYTSEKGSANLDLETKLVSGSGTQEDDMSFRLL